MITECPALKYGAHIMCDPDVVFLYRKDGTPISTCEWCIQEYKKDHPWLYDNT